MSLHLRRILVCLDAFLSADGNGSAAWKNTRIRQHDHLMASIERQHNAYNYKVHMRGPPSPSLGGVDDLPWSLSRTDQVQIGLQITRLD